MSTNYYALCDQDSLEPVEGNPAETGEESHFHIGKKSGGWRFAFQGYDESSYWGVKLTNVAEWKEFLKDKVIFDEYDRTVNQTEFWERVQVEKHVGKKHTDVPKIHSIKVEEVDGFDFIYNEFC